jgi:hypothetical protein
VEIGLGSFAEMYKILFILYVGTQANNLRTVLAVMLSCAMFL